MDEQEIRELENPETWGFDKAQTHPRVKKPRAVASVAFSREDVEQVEQQAEKLGVSLSRFIREAALDRAAGIRGRTGHLVPEN